MKFELRKFIDEFITFILPPPPISVFKECDLVKRCKKLHPTVLAGQALPDKKVGNCRLCSTVSLNTTKRTAFTLAEVLITLVVLGIIAAITIPTLRNSLDEKRYRVPLKKTYAVLSEAFDKAINFSDFNNTQILKTEADYNNFLFKYLFSNLAVGKVCCQTQGAKYGDSNCLSFQEVSLVGECFAQPHVASGAERQLTSQRGGISFTLKDGTSVVIKTTFTTAGDGSYAKRYGINPSFREGFKSEYIDENDGKTTHSLDKRYFYVIVDVNGKTAPNIIGKDIHAFVYTKSHGLLPAGVDAGSDEGIYGTCYQSGGDDWGCTYAYLTAED